MTSTLADLQRRNLKKMEDKSVDTDLRKPVDTEISEPALTEVRTEESKPLREEGSTEARQDARPALREEGSTEGRKPGRKAVSADTILSRVEEALASREPLIGGVKATVDMSPELSSRAKRYLADHRGQNSRQVIVALLDAFLSEKGY